VFVGSIYNSIDDKNRMFIPAKYCDAFDIRHLSGENESKEQAAPGKLRKDYEGKCMIFHGSAPSLYVYAIKEYERFLSDLDSVREGDEDVEDLIWHISSTSSNLDIDKQGRVTIPQSAVKYAGLSKEIVTVGMIRNLEIWDRDAFEQRKPDKDVKTLLNHARKRISEKRTQEQE
jgi:MraZ protein